MKNQPHTTTTNPQGAGHHHTQPDPGSYSWKLLLIKDARVHYVVLKQQPQTTHPTHTNMHDRCSQETRNKQTQKTTSTTTAVPAPPGPVASGPNSVPNTTQRYLPANVPGPCQPRREKSVRTSCRRVPPGTYLLIFHP